MEIRIDRLKLPSSPPEVVYFEPIIKFDNGHVLTGLPYPTRTEALAAARKLADWKYGRVCQSPKEAAELWQVGDEVESFEFLSLG